MRRKNPRRRKKRKMTRKKRPDNGTYLKVSSQPVPLLINNVAAGAPDETTTFQHQLKFSLGDDQANQGNIQMRNLDPTSAQETLSTTDITLGTKNAQLAYTQLYKYYQVYKIVVKFWPSVTEGGTFASPDLTTTQFSNAIQGQMTTDINRRSENASGQKDYWLDYPPDFKGQSKAMSRKVARNHNIYKPWTRVFTPSTLIEAQSNPKADYQYKPRYKTSLVAAQYELGNQRFVIRMKKPRSAGFPAPSPLLAGAEFPPKDSYVQFGTIQCMAYIKYQQPFN